MGVKTKITTSIVNGLKFALNGLITTAIVSIILKSIQYIVDIIPTIKKMREEADKAKNTINEITNRLKEQSNTITDVKKRYAELAQGINQVTGQNLTLSNDDYKEHFVLHTDTFYL